MPFQLTSERPLVAVLAVDTAIDAEAAALVGINPGASGERTALHSLRAASILTARRRPSGMSVALRSHSVADAAEDDVLSSVAADLSALQGEGAALVTFDGETASLPILRRRLSRHMMFGVAGAFDWSHEGGHIDLAVRHPFRAASSNILREEAAGLGIAVPAGSRKRGTTTCNPEIECAATYLIYLHAVAGAVRLAGPLLDGWRALASEIDSNPVRYAHLFPLRKPAALPCAL